MKTMKIDVISQNYIGTLEIEVNKEDFSLFSVYTKNHLLGHAHPIRANNVIRWYSPEISDKELLEQIGEWIEYLYLLN